MFTSPILKIYFDHKVIEIVTSLDKTLCRNKIKRATAKLTNCIYFTFTSFLFEVLKNLLNEITVIKKCYIKLNQ